MGHQKPTISVIIPHVSGEQFDRLLKSCVDSLVGFDELIILSSPMGTPGFTEKVNQGLTLARGDFLMVVNNDIKLTQGSLIDLCKENSVTSPKMNGKAQSFWGCFFVIPRKVYETIGLLDEQFELYCSDTDLVMRLREAGIPYECVESCNIETEGGVTTRALVDRERIEDEDTNRFISKWGIHPSQAI